MSKASGEEFKSAIVERSASAIGGGKFVNSAVAGAFIQMYNHELHFRFKFGLVIKIKKDNTQ